MTEIIIAMCALVGGLCLLFAAMAAVSDYAMPYFARRPWRVNRRRPAATRRVRT